MSELSVSSMSASPSAKGWLASPALDLAMMTCFVPLLVVVAFSPLAHVFQGRAFNAAFEPVFIIVMSVSFIHRHLVWLLAYGDPAVRAARKRLLIIAPLLAFSVVIVTHGFKVQPLRDVVVGALALWNIWHVLRQRHGVFRAYARAAGPALASQAHARRDQTLLWAWVVAIVCAVPVVIPASLAAPGVRTWAARLATVWSGSTAEVGAAAVAVAVLALTLWWAAYELRLGQGLPRVPRLVFLTSTAALLGVFLLYGPVVGYLIFSFAHSFEYLFFVYFDARKKNRINPTFASRVAGAPWGMLALIGLGLGGFALAWQVWNMPGVVIYYVTTSIIHYVYDGFLWKGKPAKPSPG